MCTQLQYHSFALPSKKYPSVRWHLFVGGFARNLLLGFLQLDELPILVGQRQFMAEPFAFANDGFPLGSTFLVELVHILDGSPVCDVPRLAFSEEAIQHEDTVLPVPNHEVRERCSIPPSSPTTITYTGLPLDSIEDVLQRSVAMQVLNPQQLNPL